MIANISIFPLGQGESLSGSIAVALEVVESSKLDYKLTAMGTIVEGEWDEVMALLKKMRAAVLEKSNRIYFAVTIDERKGKKGTLTSKVESVEKKLGKKLRK